MKIRPSWAAGFLIACLWLVGRAEVSAENSSLLIEEKRQEQTVLAEEQKALELKTESVTQAAQDSDPKQEPPIADKTLEETLLLAKVEADFLLQKLLAIVRRNEVMGIATLTDEQQAMNEKLVKLMGELSRREKEKTALEDALNKVIVAHEVLEKTSNADKKSVAREKYNAALREASEVLKGQAECPIPTAKSLTDAVVVDVDEYGKIIIINSGKFQGMKVGMSFYLVRKNEVMGECQIMEVRENLSAALFKGSEKDKTAQLGDHLVPVVAEK